MGSKLVGIEIGRGNIKVVCGNLKKDKFVMHGYKIIKTPQNAFLENGSINVNAFLEYEISRQLSDAVKIMGCKGGKCSISISGKKIIIRERKFPPASEKELEEIVKLEVQNFLPGTAEDFVVDYRVVDKIEKDGDVFLKVLIAAAPVEMINSYMQLVEESGLKISSIDIHSSCITNYAKAYALSEESNTLIADIGAKATRFVMYNGKSYFAELEVDVGGHEATELVVEFLHMSDEDIENKKIKEGKIVSSEDIDFSNEEDLYFNLGIKKTYEKIAQEIRKVMDYYRTRRFNSKIDKVIIIGGGANLSGAADYIQSIAGVQVGIVEIPQSLKLFFEEDSQKEDFAMIIPAIGAMLRGK